MTDFQLFRMFATLCSLADMNRKRTHARTHTLAPDVNKVHTYKDVRNGKSDLAYELRILHYPLLT